MPEAPGTLPVQSDPTAAAKKVRRVFKKVAQEIDVNRYGLSGLIAAIEKALGIRESSLTQEDQKELVEFLGPDAATQFLLLAEDVPAISTQRARSIANWFDMFMRAVKADEGKANVWRLGRRLGHEVISAWADKTIRS